MAAGESAAGGAAGAVFIGRLLPDSLVRRADAALYAANKLGRAEVACAGPTPTLI